ncbi:ATP synthase F1 subunit epsilon [Desertivirga arenae]|uniref:ATP synthase F1 subunit epsilon n=1 Tax=Desertivirga arenae TaxID=2810309 RepID=UPI001A95B85D|nr:ATP synthase F1 subunit epsilon [Pedobacter sp. SYSU D00823]
MRLEILTPDKTIFEGDVTSVTVPGVNGSFEVLNNHAPIISILEDGNVTIRTGKQSESLFIHGGVVEVIDNKVMLLAEGVRQ